MKKNGFTLVEILVAMAILISFVIGVGLVSNLATQGTRLRERRSEARRLATEAMEAVHSIRNRDFLSLSSGTYHPVFSGQWSLVSGAESIDGYTRQVDLGVVLREISCGGGVCPIVEEGGIVDEGSLFVEVVVSWLEGGQQQEVAINSLITHWK